MCPGDGWACDQGLVQPDICLGTDPFHTPPALTDSIEQLLAGIGWTVYRDKPYKQLSELRALDGMPQELLRVRSY